MKKYDDAIFVKVIVLLFFAAIVFGLGVGLGETMYVRHTHPVRANIVLSISSGIILLAAYGTVKILDRV